MLKIGKTPESPINRDVMKTNEVTKDCSVREIVY